jgi:hypothetical protein
MKTVTIMFSILVMLLIAVPAAADSASISGVTPKVAYSDSSVTFTITGTFNVSSQDNLNILLMKSGSDDNKTATIESLSASQIVCTFSKSKISDSLGSNTEASRKLVIGITGIPDTVYGTDITLRPAISLSAVNPTKARTNSDDVEITITGAGLSEIKDVYLHNSDEGNITKSDIDVKSATKVNATFDLDGKKLAKYEVCVKDDFGKIVCNDDVLFEVTSDAVGNIEISSSPKEATIYLDNVEKGKTPLTLSDLDVGTYKLMVKKDGYSDWMRSVTVKEGKTESFSANLEVKTTATTATPTSAPTTAPTTIKVTRKSTTATATPWPSDTPTPASPVDVLVIVGGVGLALIALRRH